MFGIAIALAAVTVIMLFWPRKTKEEELAGSLTKKVMFVEYICWDWMVPGNHFDPFTVKGEFD